MQPRINLITLGVKDLEKSLNFYEIGLGWKKSTASQESVAFFKMDNGVVLSLYPKDLLAEDAMVANNGTGFENITLAFNAKSEKEVDDIIAEVEKLGAAIAKRPQKVFWGGYSSYFKDPDGHLFEVAYNPFFPFDENNNLKI